MTRFIEIAVPKKKTMKESKVSFNEIPLLSFGEHNFTTNSVGRIEEHLVNRCSGTLYECRMVTVPCDELISASNGTLYRKSSSRVGRPGISNSRYKMFDVGFKQLLSLLQIPSGFAKRIPASLLTMIVNQLLASRFDKKVGLRLVRDSSRSECVLAIVPSGNKVALSLSDFFSDISQNNRLYESTGMLFSHAIFSGLKASAFFSLPIRANNDHALNPGIELFYGDGLDCNPTVSGTIHHRRGFAILKSLSYSIDTTSGQSVNNILQTAESAVIRVDREIEKFSDCNDACDRGLTADEIRSLGIKSSKMMNEPLALWDEMTANDLLLETFRYQSRKNLSLIEKRRAAIFAGHVIELVTNNVLVK